MKLRKVTVPLRWLQTLAALAHFMLGAEAEFIELAPVGQRDTVAGFEIGGCE